MPAKQPRVKEARAAYRAKRRLSAAKPAPKTLTLRWTDVEGATAPITLRRNGEPIAVVVKYEEYRRLDAARAERRQQAWQELDVLLAQVHSRTRDFQLKEVEADISAAREEVRREHHALRGHD